MMDRLGVLRAISVIGVMGGVAVTHAAPSPTQLSATKLTVSVDTTVWAIHVEPNVDELQHVSGAIVEVSAAGKIDCETLLRELVEDPTIVLSSDQPAPTWVPAAYHRTVVPYRPAFALGSNAKSDGHLICLPGATTHLVRTLKSQGAMPPAFEADVTVFLAALAAATGAVTTQPPPPTPTVVTTPPAEPAAPNAQPPLGGAPSGGAPTMPSDTRTIVISPRSRFRVRAGYAHLVPDGVDAIRGVSGGATWAFRWLALRGDLALYEQSVIGWMVELRANLMRVGREVHLRVDVSAGGEALGEYMAAAAHGAVLLALSWGALMYEFGYERRFGDDGAADEVLRHTLEYSFRAGRRMLELGGRVYTYDAGSTDVATQIALYLGTRL